MAPWEERKAEGEAHKLVRLASPSSRLERTAVDRLPSVLLSVRVVVLESHLGCRGNDEHAEYESSSRLCRRPEEPRYEGSKVWDVGVNTTHPV